MKSLMPVKFAIFKNLTMGRNHLIWDNLVIHDVKQPLIRSTPNHTPFKYSFKTRLVNELYMLTLD